MSAYCVLRKYKEGDEHVIKEIISESVMEQVTSYFWKAFLSELFPQIAIACVAISYIFFGIPLKYSLILIPGSLIFIYLVVFLGHFIKAQELNNDLDNIPNNYMHDNSTTFLVAEYFGKVGEAELSSLMNKPKKFEYNFYTEKEFQMGNINASGVSKIVVGCVAITRSMRNSERAWLRRMAVKKEYRRRGIGTNLLKEAVKFCEQKKYSGIELITTEQHEAAKRMYYNEGFINSESTYKSFLGFGGSLVSFKMYLPLKKSEEIEDEKESQNKTDKEEDLIHF